MFQSENVLRGESCNSDNLIKDAACIRQMIKEALLKDDLPKELIPDLQMRFIGFNTLCERKAYYIERLIERYSDKEVNDIPDCIKSAFGPPSDNLRPWMDDESPFTSEYTPSSPVYNPFTPASYSSSSSSSSSFSPAYNPLL